jgi:hypothetical protein
VDKLIKLLLMAVGFAAYLYGLEKLVGSAHGLGFVVGALAGTVWIIFIAMGVTGGFEGLENKE